MFTLRGSCWGPVALPELLRSQLAAHGFTPEDAGRCARLINDHPVGAAAASLFVDLGSCKFLEADIDGAIAAWRHAIASQHDAAAARAMLNLGLLYEHLHLHEQALGLLARVAERNIEPYVVPAAMASARIQVALGNTEQAMETMARLAQMVMARRPDDAELIEALYGLGEVAEHAGRLDRAERAWRVAAASPSSVVQEQAAARLIQLLVQQGHSQAVEPPANELELAGPETHSALLGNAELLLRTGEKSMAAKLLVIIDAAQIDVTARFRFVDANLMAGRINEAIDELEVLLASDDAQVQYRALFTLGRVYASYDMIDPAVSMFQRAVASDDPYWMPAASLALGDVLAARGDQGPANEYWSYAAAGSVARLAEQAQDRIASLDAQKADLVSGESDVAEPSESALSSAHVNDVVPEVAHTVTDPPPAEIAEPQPISLDTAEAETSPSANGAASNGLASDEQRGSDEGTSEGQETEPVLVVLADVEAIIPAGDADPSSASRPSVEVEPTSDVVAAPSAFADYVDSGAPANPYAALAPDGHASDIAPTTRNPYAELAPNFATTEFEPPDDVEPGDWESMLEDWPADESTKPKKHPSAFSRYT